MPDGSGSAERAARRAAADELIAYHAPIAHRLTSERTSYRSQHIPVTPYILVACAEAFARYPDMVRRIDAAMPAEEIGRRARRPGVQVNTVFLWSLANFYLVGRQIWTGFDPSVDSVDDTHDVLDFWSRAATGFRGDGTRQACDGGGAVRVYADEIVDQLAATATASLVDDDARAAIRTLNASLVNYLFLLYFDTRVGSGDTGPYALGGDRTMIVRDYYRLGHSDLPWSDVAASVPVDHLVAAFVVEGVERVEISDFGTCRTDPESYLDHLVGFSLFTTDGCAPGEMRPLDDATVEVLRREVRRAEVALYRRIAAMDRDEMIRCGSYVYFTFLRPFAEIAGVADELDWSVPRDLEPPVYDLIVAIGTEMETNPPEFGDDPELYYARLGPDA